MSKVATKTRMQALLDLGQSVWLDYLRRGMLQSGELQRMIDDGLRGMTSNPTIFEHAIGGSTDYDEALSRIAASSRTDREIFDLLAVDDVRTAADFFRPVYDASRGADGFVSLEVSPTLARDTAGTIGEARRLWAAVDRPNVMIKVPGTREGWPAIERLLTDGINVNITLLFSLEHYRQVAEAYLRALEARRNARQPIDHVASVASFFVSRVDTEVDRRLDAKSDLRGTVAIANANLAYAWFRELLDSPRWRALAAAGAKPQRLLWASTGTKDPAYSDVLYVDSLIGADTINTLPPQTLQLFEDHGAVRETLPGDAAAAQRVIDGLRAAAIDFDDVARVLEREGIEKFAHSFETLLGVIAAKRKTLAAAAPPRHSAELRAFDQAVAQRLVELERADVPKRIWGRDPTVWKPDPDTPEISDRLGWLNVGKMMAQQVKPLTAFAEEIRREFDRVVLCGMGGSSLAPEVLWRTFGQRTGFPTLAVLDSTDPRAVTAALAGGALERTLFLVSSKSGTTQETDCLYRYFWERAGGRGAQFVAITDPDTPLARLAAERGFRRAFLNPKDIGGRYSALSYFGLVPAALIGIDVGQLLHRAHRMAEACAAWVPARQNPAAWLGAILAEAALAGRNKATFVLAPGIDSFGLWVEQLIAESTGKEGKGILPVAEEPLGSPQVYGRDRLFVALTLAGEEGENDATEPRLRALMATGHPVVRLALEDRYDLGQEFFRWEFATAVAGAILQINAFDQPNVAESKQNTKDVLAGKQPPAPPATAAELERFLAAVRPGDYLALMAYLPPTPQNDRRLGAVRARLRDRLTVATTLGYGPRFLHSTGQLHKGGPPVGHFLQITERPDRDVAIPSMPYTFGQLEAAQAEGDLRALRGRGRPAVRIDGLAPLER